MKGGRPPLGSCTSRPCEYIQLPNAAHAEGFCQPNGSRGFGGQRRRQRLPDRFELQLRFQRRVGLDDERRRRRGVGADLALAARERLQERAQVLPACAGLVFAHHQHELVVGRHAGLIDGDRDRVLVHQR